MNVALPANGATLAATYGLGSIASFVNDGDSTTTTNFWAANIVGDTVTIDFGRLRNVTSVTVYTNDTSFNSVSPAKYIEISSDSTVWKKTAQLTGGDVGCSSYSAGSGKISCTFSATQSVRYLRARVTSATPGGQHIVELEAQGT
ncbi:MAG: discoidin domain-containing protein [Moraxellaceae bacterium]